jgi:hypothetical protein
MLRVVGIVALFVLAAACGQTTAQVVPSPSPVIAEGNWAQSLTFAGEVPGSMSAIVPDTTDVKSECTGQKSHVGDAWADTFYGTLDASGDVWGVVFDIANFSGPGTYLDGAIVVEMHNAADLTKVWQSRTGDKVTFTIDRNQQSGTIDATLTNAQSGKAAAQHITGRWNCRG